MQLNMTVSHFWTLPQLNLSAAGSGPVRKNWAENGNLLLFTGNDGQCGYLAAVIKSRYENDPVVNKILHYFTTHTYANRGVWQDIGGMKGYMTYLGIKPKYQAAAFRMEMGNW